MISDELRELLSAYVDGELPHGESARIEESAKRDPRLRRRIRAYRRLSETLRVWDVEEHGQWPSRNFKARALAQVRAYEAERRHEIGGGPSLWWQRPAAFAAGLLLAVGLGALLAVPSGDARGTAESARSGPLALAPVEPYGDLGALLEADELPPLPEGSGTLPDLSDIVRYETVGIPVTMDGEIVYVRNQQTLKAMDWIRNLDDRFERGGVPTKIEETRTGTQPNTVLASMLEGSEVHLLEGGLVALKRPAPAGKLPAMRAAPARTEAASRHVEAADNMGARHYLAVKRGGLPVLTLAGEVWVEPLGDGERVGRSRVLAGTSFVKSGELVKAVWASPVEADPRANWAAFRAEALVLGPKARQRLLGKNGRVDDVLAWLEAQYGRGMVAAGRAAAKRHASTVKKMVDALRRDAEATGFAVFGADGELLGTEVFATHELMMEFAPRLLCGYLLETGGAIRLEAEAAEAALARVRRFLNHDAARKAQRVQDVRTWQSAEDWPSGMRQVNLVTPTRQVIGHGLFLGDELIQLSLFGS